MNPVVKTFQLGRHTVTLETGRIARQASGAVLAKMDDTTVLVTVVGVKEAKPDASFFPLSVHYMEKTYAAGKIPGGFFKREGRPSEKETLTSRLIDRPIRPLFPNGFMNEVQVVAQVLSVDGKIDPDIVAMLGTSAALAVSGVPFNGPIGASRVGYKEGEYLLNPTFEELDGSDLDLVVAGTENAVLMVESEAKELSEEVMLGAVLFGHKHYQTAISAIKEFAEEAKVENWEWQPEASNESVIEKVTAKAADGVATAYAIREKLSRKKALSELKEQTLEALVEAGDISEEELDDAKDAFSDLEKSFVRSMILNEGQRIDGRDTKTVRPISIDVGLLPRTHGSALFTRGETQAIVTATLGTERDSQIIDALEGEKKDPFLLHYNFPPFCVGEAGMVGGPKRREIGHGKLAKRALATVMPSLEEFPYAMRVVSEITESNGSSSMATVCGGSLALMDAGVPISSPVAGIAMGLIKEGDRVSVLSDILGDEDHLGDMDFKVAGTENGVTALQMDIKIEGIDSDIMKTALEQAKDGRFHILGEMAKVIKQPREEMSQHAPRIVAFSVPSDKIRDVIGKGGETIRGLISEFGVSIDIDDDGTVKIGAVDAAAGDAARKQIELITAEVEVGKTYEGTVAKILDFGAIVSILPNKDGLVHISELAPERVNQVTDIVNEGDKVSVKVIEIDRQGRTRLSMKQANT